MTERKCKNCVHFSGGVVSQCKAPLPEWFTMERPRIYGEDGTECDLFEDFRS